MHENSAHACVHDNIVCVRACARLGNSVHGVPARLLPCAPALPGRGVPSPPAPHHGDDRSTPDLPTSAPFLQRRRELKRLRARLADLRELDRRAAALPAPQPEPGYERALKLMLRLQVIRREALEAEIGRLGALGKAAKMGKGGAQEEL